MKNATKSTIIIEVEEFKKENKEYKLEIAPKDFYYIVCTGSHINVKYDNKTHKLDKGKVYWRSKTEFKRK